MKKGDSSTTKAKQEGRIGPVDEKLMTKLLAFLVIIVSIGWFITFVIVPAIQPSYHPPQEITVLMSAAFTSVGGLLGGTYLKVKRSKGDEGKDEDRNGRSGHDRDG